MAIDFEEIKRRNPLENVIERFTQQRVERHKIRCPFHEDRTPSLHVYDDGGWKCWGCGKFGDCLDFVGYFLYGDAYEPSQHLTDVIDRLGTLNIKPLPSKTTKPKPKPLRAGLNVTLEQCMEWSDHMPDARRAYWHRRGLTDQTIREFFLGWDGKRYTIPIHYRYQVFGVKRRKSEIDDGLDAKYVQLKGSRVGIFNSDALWDATHAVICEGEIDCMLLHQAGFTAVTSTGGANTWKRHWSKFFAHIPDVYALFDNDDAGADGASKVKRCIRRANVLTLPDGIQDVGDMFERYPEAVEWMKTKLSRV